MITEKQKQIFKLLIDSQNGHNINQIAKLTNSSVSWTYETLKLLAKQGHLIPFQVANSVMFKINFENKVTQKLLELIIIEERSQNKTQEHKVYTVKESSKNNDPIPDKPLYKVPKIMQEASSLKYQKLSDAGQSNFNYSSKSTMPMSSPNAYSVPKAGDVNAVLSGYAASGSGGIISGYAASSSSNQHYGSTGAVSPVSVESKVSDNVAKFTFNQHISHLTAGNAPGCRYCGPEIKII